MDSSPFLSDAPPVPATQIRGWSHGAALRPVSGTPVWRGRRGGRPGPYGSRRRRGASSGHVFRHGETHSRRPSSSPSVLSPAPPTASPACTPPKSPWPAAVPLPVRPLFPSACGELRAPSTRAAGVMAAAAVCLGHGRGERSLVLPACGSARLPPALALWGWARCTPPRLHLALRVKQVRECRWFDPDIGVATDTFGGEGQNIAVHVAHQGTCGHFQRVWMAPLVHEDHEHGAQEARAAVFDARRPLRGPPPRAPTGRLPPAGHRASNPAGAGVRRRRRPGGGPPWRTGRSVCRASSLQAYVREAPCAFAPSMHSLYATCCHWSASVIMALMTVSRGT